VISYKNIIFDLGGVILKIDYKRTIEAFKNLGIVNAETLYSKAAQSSLFDNLEKGLISESDFYDGIRMISDKQITNNQIKDAWNAILIGLPEENVLFLEKLKKTHRLFLLSNTNSIHEKAYREMIVKQFGSFIFDELFEKMYLSHHIHMRKPEPEIFKYVLSDRKLNINETCFIDDSPQHVEGAGKAGIRSFLLKNENVVELVNSIAI
jgi:putative hydrolase of the HAD superfamily